MTAARRLQDLRNAMARQGIDAFLVPTQDSYLSEYPPLWERRLEWLTGFTGSAGTAVVLEKQAALITDGRYMLQAADQLDSSLYQVVNSAEQSLADWLIAYLPRGSRVGLDARLFSQAQWQRLQQNLQAGGLTCRAMTANLIDGLWTDRPATVLTPITLQEMRYAGLCRRDKCQQLAEVLQQMQADYLLLTAPDSIAWLLNIRAQDLPHVPVALSTLLFHAPKQGESSLQWFVDVTRLEPDLRQHLGEAITVKAPAELASALQQLGRDDGTLRFDPTLTPRHWVALLEEADVSLQEGDDPCQRMKACKHPVEQAGARQAHLLDGVALTRFLHYLATANLSAETEYTLGERLDSLRMENPACLDTSFDAIVGYQANGAIVHYRARRETARPIQGEGLLLVDSGGQYREGTTDVTRTVAIGQPTDEQRRAYTAVLKGHIALAMAHFPVGTTGSQLDALARYPLWQLGLDYDHGTGHGVGSYLSVHEGPQRISKIANSVALQPGMILSNEPGYYQSGAFGIRLENLVLVQPAGLPDADRPFLRFESLTLAPFDLRLMNVESLSFAEKDWLNRYHQQVVNALLLHLPGDVGRWLQEVCSPV